MVARIFVVTPAYDAADAIDATVLSAVSQKGAFILRFHVQDGGSTDGTLARLRAWERRLTDGSVPIQCLNLEFSYASAPDGGLYDRLVRGLTHVAPRANDFVTWLEPGDVLLPGAAAFVGTVGAQFQPREVSWIAGTPLALQDEVPVAREEPRIPKAALMAGLCDGVHWHTQPHTGSFFQAWLWGRAEPERTLAPLRHAGDWNFWRLSAARATPVQCPFPLAARRLPAGRSADHLDPDWLAEIDSVMPRAERALALENLAEGGDVKRQVFRARSADGRLSIVEEVLNRQYTYFCRKVFGPDAPRRLRHDDVPEKVLFHGKLSPSAAAPAAEGADPIAVQDNIVAWDRDWQFPAITEQHAFHRMRDIGAVPDGMTYVAYPWATLVDKIQARARDGRQHLEAFRRFCARLPADTLKVTVCQHILMRHYLWLFREAGIGVVFWPHATRQDVAAGNTAAPGELSLHPFPLYPVQVPETAEAEPRRWLFSFVGAKPNTVYLTRAREWILERLAEHPRGLVVGRDGWHYDRIVYEHQIRGTAAAGDPALTDTAATDQFKASLQGSVFALCPSGSGPNSIRLWEALGAGAIPVILADTYAPPGDPALWQAGAVFCEETEEAIAALPARLEALEADPGRLEAMRQAGRQLWLLYGRESFVYDVQKFLLEAAEGGRMAGPGHVRLTERLAARLGADGDRAPPPAAETARLLLRSLAADLLTGRAGPEDAAPPGRYAAALDVARRALPEDDGTAAHLEAVLAHLAPAPPAPLAAPAPARGEGPRICLFGRHSNRTPLAYRPFRRLAEGRVAFTEDPRAADLVVTGFSKDIRDNAAAFAGAAQAGARIVVLSEEPLWDSLWSGGNFTERARAMKTEAGELPFTFLNHHNSAIFAFERIPYFLLTNEDFLTRYGLWIDRYAQMTPRALRDHWAAAAIPAAFYAEKRAGKEYSKVYEAEDVRGLSAFRTEVAEAVTLPGTVRVGQGWGAALRRQDLPDWHLDKLVTLNGRGRVASAYENTHERAYISEKIFDAFVVGGVPTYHASPRHRVFDLVPQAAMLNAHGLTPQAAAAQIADFAPDSAFAEAWLAAAAALRTRFMDSHAVRRERGRVVDSVLAELDALL